MESTTDKLYEETSLGLAHTHSFTSPAPRKWGGPPDTFGRAGGLASNPLGEGWLITEIL